MNTLQTIQQAETAQKDFLVAYTKAWLAWLREYKKNSDPEKQYNSWDIYDIEQEHIFPSLTAQFSEVIGMLRSLRPEVRETAKIIRYIAETMLDRGQVHYKQHEFAPLPPTPTQNLTPHPPEDGWKPRFNANKTSQNTLIIGPLVLTWSTRNYDNHNCTHYELYTLDGRFIGAPKSVRNGNLRRFKDPTKRHAAAISKVQKLAQTTDWYKLLAGEFTNAQTRSLWVSIKNALAEDWT